MRASVLLEGEACDDEQDRDDCEYQCRAAGAQEAVNSAEYKALILATVNFWIDNGYIQRGQSVTEFVNNRWLGHGEFTEIERQNYPGNMNINHTDMPSLVMDPLRAMAIKLLMDMGYTR